MNLREAAMIEATAFVHWAVHQGDFTPWMKRFYESLKEPCPCGRPEPFCGREKYLTLGEVFDDE